jgi:exodeoxyribonuclease V
MAEKAIPYKYRRVPKADRGEHSFIADVEKQLGGRLTENSLSKEQHDAFATICKWYEKKEGPLLTLGGYAGTGKSTLVSVLAGKYCEERIDFCAFTGKATSVLRKKFSEANIQGRQDVSTLHSLIYYPIPNEVTGGVRGWRKKASLDCDLVVVDEASMLNKDLFEDLMSYNIPILAVGDHGQLPPVFGSFSLMERPHLRLETIHRQAQNSPILALSEFVRRTGQVPRFAGSTEVQVLEMDQIDEVVGSLFTHPGVRFDDVAMICYRNETRVELNARARAARGFPGNAPVVGDQLICLKNTDKMLFNGMRGRLTKVRPQTKFLYNTKVFFEDDEIEVEGDLCIPQLGRPTTYKDFDEFEQENNYRPTSWDQMGLLMDYGHALTCHKAQGSSFEHAIVVAERPGQMSFDDWKRWLYTAVTRCSKYLVVLQ